MSLYNVYQQGFLGSHSTCVGINQALLDKMVSGYFKGLNDVTYHGKTYPICNQNFQIYDIGDIDLMHAREMFDSLLGVHGMISETLFEKTGANVTAKYLKNFAWGDLKEDYFNLSLKESANCTNFLALSKGQVNKFLNDYAQGTPTIMLAGEELILTGAPRKIQIFNINTEYLSQKRGTILKNLSEYLLKRHLTWDKATFSNVGIEVTEEFNIRPFGIESLGTMSSRLSVINNTVYSSIKKNKIFISHSSLDSEIVTSFVNNILINAFEIKAADIFCTSTEGLGIHSGFDFRNAIKDELQKSKMVIQILSEHYKKSEVCLNEMGAAWAITDTVVPFVLKQNEYDIGFLHKTNQQLVLTDRQDIFKFLDDYRDLLQIQNNVSRISACIDTFIKSISASNGLIFESSSVVT